MSTRDIGTESEKPSDDPKRGLRCAAAILRHDGDQVVVIEPNSRPSGGKFQGVASGWRSRPFGCRFHKVLILAEKRPVMLSRNPLLSQLKIAERLEAIGASVTRGRPRGARGFSDFDKSAFDAKLASRYVVATGTLVLTRSLRKGPFLSPPIHVALYRRDQLVGSLRRGFGQNMFSRSETNPAARLVLITGTSRTTNQTNPYPVEFMAHAKFTPFWWKIASAVSGTGGKGGVPQLVAAMARSPRPMAA